MTIKRSCRQKIGLMLLLLRVHPRHSWCVAAGIHLFLKPYPHPVIAAMLCDVNYPDYTNYDD